MVRKDCNFPVSSITPLTRTGPCSPASWILAIVAATFFSANGGTSKPAPGCAWSNMAYCIGQSAPPPASPMGIATLKTVSLRSNTPISRPAPPLLPPEIIVMPYERLIGSARLPGGPPRPGMPPEMEIPPVPPLLVTRPLALPLPLPRAGAPLPEPGPGADVVPVAVLSRFPLAEPGTWLSPDPAALATSALAPLPLYGCEALFFGVTLSADRPVPLAGDFSGIVAATGGPPTKLPANCASGI